MKNLFISFCTFCAVMCAIMEILFFQKKTFFGPVFFSFWIILQMQSIVFSVSILLLSVSGRSIHVSTCFVFDSTVSHIRFSACTYLYMALYENTFSFQPKKTRSSFDYDSDSESDSDDESDDEHQHFDTDVEDDGLIDEKVNSPYRSVLINNNNMHILLVYSCLVVKGCVCEAIFIGYLGELQKNHTMSRPQQKHHLCL